MLGFISVWALSEAIFFFLVADIPIMALGMMKGWRKALVGAGFAALAAAIGGGCVYLWSSTNPEEVYTLMLAIPAIDETLLNKVSDDWHNGGAINMAKGSFSGVPYKLYAHVAGVTSNQSIAGLVGFFLASILARLPRFALVAGIAGWLGPRLIKRFGARYIWTGFFLGWAGFYALYWSVTGF